MTNLLLNLFAPSPASATGKGLGASARPANSTAPLDLFRLALAGQFKAATPAAPASVAVTSSTTPDSGSSTAAQTALETKIKKMIAAGASNAEIVASLATTLAASVAAQLGAAGADARQKLQAVFATALAPPGETPPAGTAADRARALAQRYRQIEAVATATAAQHSPGQQNRIAGTVSDTQHVKDGPAQGSNLAALAPPTSVAPVTNSVPTAAAASVHANAVAAAAVHAATAVHATAVAATAVAAAAVQSAAVAAAAVHASAHAGAGGAALPTAAVSSALAKPAPVDPATIQPVAIAAAMADGRPAESSRPVIRGTATTPATTGDGRIVQSGALPVVSTGGDTGLGRILTRASLAADARAVPPKAVPPTATSDADSVQDARRPASDAPGAHGGVESFVKAFTVALAASAPDDTKTAVHAALQAVPLDTSGQQPAAPVAAFGSPVAPPITARIEAAAPTPAAAQPAPIDHSAIADQVLRGAFMRNVGTSSEMRLSLVPESLGDVNVKLVVNEGTVTAHVVAQTADVRDALVAAQPQLTKSLADAGLKLSSFTVDLSGGGFTGFSQQQNDRPTPDGRAAAASYASDDAATDDARLEAIPSFGPSIAGPNPSDYNYLA